ncbi:MAG: anti-sigma factor family protein [Blastocatellia bacterium]
MKCAKAENLIPLFAGGDLPSLEAGALRAHLAGCPRCAAMAAEFTDCREWFQSLRTPAFDERALEDMRGAVLGAINDDAPRDAWRRRRLRPRLLLLAASLLLFAGLGLLARHFATKPAPDLTNETRREARPAPSPATRGEAPPAQRVARPRRAAPRAPMAPSPVQTDLASADSTDKPRTLRIEMQTEDPNIRIIWFAPAPGASTQPK